MSPIKSTSKRRWRAVRSWEGTLERSGVGPFTTSPDDWCSTACNIKAAWRNIVCDVKYKY